MLNTRPCDPASTKVLLLKGGTSGEREISLVSGAAVAKALREMGFDVTEVDTGEDGYLHTIIETPSDVVFICLHGKYGEDGTMQGLCELLGKPYVGPGVLASALAMDKARAKHLYVAAGLSTPTSFVLSRDDEYTIDKIVAAVGERCVVKPTTEGSALGVTIVHDPADLQAAIDTVFAIDSTALIESYVSGIEVTAAVMGNADPIALPIIEIIPQNEFYDFESKYAPGGAQHICPARISDEATQACQKAAIAAHEALGCKGVSRTDIIIDDAGTCWVLETNTIPGMTATSLLPDAARAIGIEFPDLCKKMVELALEDTGRLSEAQAKVTP